MKILLFNNHSYTREDIMDVLRMKGIHVEYMDHQFKDKNQDDKFLFDFKKMIVEKSFDLVFSINYYPLLAQVCYDLKMKYISWSYDCPLDVRNIEETLGYPTNYVFLYDKLQTQKYIDMGFENIYHLPLAVNTKRLDKMVVKPNHIRDFSGDIAFVGKLYQYVYPEIVELLPEYLQGYLDGICESQLNVYGCYFLDQIVTESLLSELNKIWYNKDGFRMIKEELTYAMAAHITNKERMSILSGLADNLEGRTINLFSGDKFKYKGISEKGRVNYWTEMPYVFKTNKINLNMSLKCIYSGIPLRVVDIMGSRGFLLTNFQSELLDYFEPGEDLAVYTGLEEAIDLSYYYLNNESERNKIIENGYLKVKKHFNYIDRLDTIFKTVGI